MLFKGIHHVSVNVRNLEEAQHFYIDILGLELLYRPDVGVPGLWIRAGEHEIHLLGTDSGEPLQDQHFALYVDDVDEISAFLKGHGLKVSKASEIPGVCRAIFTRDPSGNMIEFNQRLG